MTQTDGTHILAVDDEDASVFAYTAYFSEPGVTVHGAHNLEEARALMAHHTFDAGIIDLRLSGSDTFEGYTVIQELKQRNQDAVIVVVTAYNKEAIRTHVHALGADRFMEKPVPPSRIGEALQQLGVLTH